MRIFIVTIFLSVVLLGISVTELLCCFKIIKDVSTFVEWKFLLYYLLSESVPSLTIACFLNSGNEGKMRVFAPRDSYEYMSGHKSSHVDRERIQRRRATNDTSRRSDAGIEGSFGNLNVKRGYNSDDSEYGNFNPNLYAHQR